MCVCVCIHFIYKWVKSFMNGEGRGGRIFVVLVGLNSAHHSRILCRFDDIPQINGRQGSQLALPSLSRDYCHSAAPVFLYTRPLLRIVAILFLSTVSESIGFG